MALIAASVERPGIARIFFDMRPAGSTVDAEKRIARAIETAFTMAVAHVEPEVLSAAA